jgi:hypothetical protein
MRKVDFPRRRGLFCSGSGGAILAARNKTTAVRMSRKFQYVRGIFFTLDPSFQH